MQSSTARNIQEGAFGVSQFHNPHKTFLISSFRLLCAIAQLERCK